jgi:hypothetical protein
MKNVQNHKDLTPTEIADYITMQTGIKISNRKVNQLLEEIGLQKKITTPQKKSYWRLTEKGKKYGNIYRVDSQYSLWSGTQIKWNENTISIIKLKLAV